MMIKVINILDHSNPKREVVLILIFQVDYVLKVT
jgi:hypothetical protein